MNNKWRWVPGIILAAIMLFLVLSLWTLFLPHYRYGMLNFGVMFPVWLITIALAFSFATWQER